MPDGRWFSVVQGQFKGLAVITQGHCFSKTGVKRSPEPQKQVSGTAQFTATTLQHQAQHQVLWWGVEQRFDDLKIPADLLQTADQKPLRHAQALISAFGVC